VGAQTGVYAYASVNAAKSHGNTDSTTHNNTHLTANTINMQSAGDTTLKGATANAFDAVTPEGELVKGGSINVDTGGQLIIESLQDTAKNKNKNSGFNLRVQVSFGTAWNASGSVSTGQANGDYANVREQTGLFAGSGGYHVNAGDVNLIGGAITSTNPDNSVLTANSLTFSNIQNRMDYDVSSMTLSGSYGYKLDKGDKTGTGGQDSGSSKSGTGGQDSSSNNKPSIGEQASSVYDTIAHDKYGTANDSSFGGALPIEKSGSDSSTTYATLTEGNITLGGQQTTAADTGIHTNAADANAGIDALPDLQKMQSDQKAMTKALGTVTSTVTTIVASVAKDFADKAKKDGKDDVAKDWASNGNYTLALQAVTTVVIGATAGQNGTQIAGNALAPYATKLIGEQFGPDTKDSSKALDILSRAVVGAVLAEVNGYNPAVGAASSGGEMAMRYLITNLYDGDSSKLTPDKLQALTALSQAAGALASYTVGNNNNNDAATGTATAKNALTNIAKPK
jgi:filamentous hemagglutinin